MMYLAPILARSTSNNSPDLSQALSFSSLQAVHKAKTLKADTDLLILDSLASIALACLPASHFAPTEAAKQVLQQ